MTDVPSSSPIPVAGMRVSPEIELVAPLGSGSMGAVWKADHRGLNRAVAVKFIAADLRKDPTLRRRFEREAQAAALVETPHVVEILGQGVTQRGMPFMVMELLEGETLAELLKREEQISPRRVAVIVAQVAKALDGAHKQGIVHRDIKPENIFLIATGDDMLVKVLDFGVAKVAQSFGLKLTMGETVLGTPYYVSAEQIRSSADVTPLADLWSLAVVCYEALTGYVPFGGDNVAELFLNIQAGVIQRPSELRPALTPEIDSWFAQALNKDSDARFQSAMEFAASFLEVASTLPDVFDDDEDYDEWLRTGQFKIPTIPPSSMRHPDGARAPKIEIPRPPLAPREAAKAEQDADSDDHPAVTVPLPDLESIRITQPLVVLSKEAELDSEEFRATLPRGPRRAERMPGGEPEPMAERIPAPAAGELPEPGTSSPAQVAEDGEVDPLAATAFDEKRPPSTEPTTLRRRPSYASWLPSVAMGVLLFAVVAALAFFFGLC